MHRIFQEDTFPGGFSLNRTYLQSKIVVFFIVKINLWSENSGMWLQATEVLIRDTFFNQNLLSQSIPCVLHIREF